MQRHSLRTASIHGGEEDLRGHSFSLASSSSVAFHRFQDVSLSQALRSKFQCNMHGDVLILQRDFRTEVL